MGVYRYDKDRERVLAWAKKKRLEDPEWAQRQRDALNRRQKAQRSDPEWLAGKNRRRTLSRYGISEEDYAAMLEAQNGVCAICEKDPPPGSPGEKLHIDHCHKTGEVRGLLCYYCNTGMGKLRDDPDLLRKAIEYLEKKR